MRRLTLALVALLISAPSFGAGWTDNNGKMRNDAVAADASAIHRGGSLNLDPGTLQQELLPWTDEDGDSITVDFVLPGAIENCSTTPVGWECDVNGSAWRAGVADLDGVKGLGKLSTAMDGFTAPGAQSYVRVPFGEVVDHGSNKWRPVDKQLGGDWQDFTFTVQPALTAQEILDGASRPDWAVGSIAIYHNSKRNDINSPRGPPRYYMTGKAAHMPAPVAVGFRSNLTTITGWTYGWFEFDDQTGRIKKVFPYDVVAGWSAQTASVVVDATLGYTVVGGTSARIISSPWANSVKGNIATEAGTINSLTWLNLDGLTSSRVRIYSDATVVGVGSPSVWDVSDIEWPVGAGGFEDWGVISGINTAMVSGNEYEFLRVGPYGFSDKYDTDASYGQPVWTGGDPGATWTTPTIIDPSRRISAFITYTTAAPPVGGATDSGPLNLGLGLQY